MDDEGAASTAQGPAVIDAPLRRLAAPALSAAGTRLAAAGVQAQWLTAVGWVVGSGACVAAAFHAWPWALAAWLANRTIDGLDGPVARVSGATERGALADLAADFSIYGGFVIGVAVAKPDARLACVCLLASCYVAGTAYVALSSLTERRLVGGLTEGAETILAYAAVCVVPAHAAGILWVFAGAVGLTAVTRIGAGLLSPGDRLRRADGPAPAERPHR